MLGGLKIVYVLEVTDNWTDPYERGDTDVHSVSSTREIAEKLAQAEAYETLIWKPTTTKDGEILHWYADVKLYNTHYAIYEYTLDRRFGYPE